MTDQRRQGFRRRGVDRSLLRAAVLSAFLHALAIALVLLAPHRLPSAPPTAYTVEVVDPSALGGKLLAGPIGGDAAARRSSAGPPKAPADLPAKKDEAPPPKPEVPKPDVVVKVEPPASEPEPKLDKDIDAVPIKPAQATAQATKKPPASPKPKPTAALPAKPKPTASPMAVAERAQPSPAASPKSEPEKPSEAREADRESADLESRLAAAIESVEKKVERTGGPAVGAVGPAGGHGGAERTLDRPPGIGGDGPGGGGVVRGLDFVVYYDQMLSRIKENWTWVGARADLRVTVRFSILETGEVADLQLVERSGDTGYDASVVRAVKRASPLGPPPEAYRRDFADVELTFRPADLGRPPG